MKLRKRILLMLSFFFVGCGSNGEENNDSSKPSLNIEATKNKAQEALAY